MQNRAFRLIALLTMTTILQASCDITIEHSVYLPADESEQIEEYVAPCCEARCEGCRKNNPNEHKTV